MSSPIHVLLADDHPLFLEGVRNVLLLYPDVEVVALCSDGASVLAQLPHLKVDVAVFDISMPEVSGIELAHHIEQHFPNISVVILTMHHPGELRAGPIPVLGYVLKNSGSETLYHAICAAARKERYVDSRLGPADLDSGEEIPSIPRLSLREKEILKQLVLGKNNREIADALFVSELTVKTHRKNIYRKLQINNVSTLILKAHEFGLLK